MRHKTGTRNILEMSLSSISVGHLLVDIWLTLKSSLLSQLTPLEKTRGYQLEMASRLRKGGKFLLLSALELYLVQNWVCGSCSCTGIHICITKNKLVSFSNSALHFLPLLIPFSKRRSELCPESNTRQSGRATLHPYGPIEHVCLDKKKGDVNQTELSDWLIILNSTVLLQKVLILKEKKIFWTSSLFNERLMIGAPCRYYYQYVKCVMMYVYLFTSGKERKRLYKDMGIQSVRSKTVKHSLASRIKDNKHGNSYSQAHVYVRKPHWLLLYRIRNYPDLWIMAFWLLSVVSKIPSNL